jgi:dipeptidyl aminopeptidase/acylaminoacyl peptidase
VKKLYFVLLFVSFFSGNAYAQSSLTIDKIMQDPKWIGTSPSNHFWALDNSKIYFSWNPEKAFSDSLYQFNLKTNEYSKVVSSQKAGLYSNGGSYNTDRSQFVYSAGGDLFVFYSNSGKVKRLTQTADYEVNPIFSIDNQKIFFQKESGVFSFDLNSGLLAQLVEIDKGTKLTEKKKSDQEEWLQNDQLQIFDILKEKKAKKDAAKALEPKTKEIKKIYLDGKRIQGLTVSPDGKTLAFNLIETPKNSKSTIVPNYFNESGYTEDIPARNKVGSPQSISESFVFDINKDSLIKFNSKSLPGLDKYPSYLSDYPKIDSLMRKKGRNVNFSGFTWSPLGQHLIAVGRSEDNKDRWICKINISNGKTESLDHQHDEAWIGGPGISGFGGGTLGFGTENQIYFQSEETGYSHLYIYDILLKSKRALTSGKYEILKAELSADKTKFFITSNEIHPGEQHFYHLSVGGGKAIKITQLTGAHDVSVSPDEKWLAVRYSYSNKPWELYFQKNEAQSELMQATSSLSDDFKNYSWRDPQLLSFKASDGQDIYGRLYKPKKSNKKAVVFVHGAGYLQNAHKWWSNYFREYMFHNLLADMGYTVFDIDYRASSGYGRDHRTGIYRHMGGKDLTDHVDAANYLVKNHGVDKNKIGIYGGSYGGFITLMAMFTSPGTFKAGAALRPVTDWAAYNHGYTSNILNTPQTDSIAYKKSSPIYFANGLKDHLLICHGVVDVNVHYQDVVRLSQRLIELRKENWELASYPAEDHGFVEPVSWADEYKRILKLFEEKMR